VGKERPRSGPLNRIFEDVCFRYIVREDRGSRWKLLVLSPVYPPMIRLIESHTSADDKPRREKIGYRAKNHKISEVLVLREVCRSRGARTPEFVDTFPRLSAIQSTESHFLSVAVTLYNTLTS
jgi:hypothetical protein